MLRAMTVPPSTFLPVIGNAVVVLVIEKGTVPGVGAVLGPVTDAVPVFIHELMVGPLVG